MTTYEYEVVRNIPEIGARVWDVLVWRHPDIYLCRKRQGQVRHWKYPIHYTFLFLAYEDHLTPMSPECPRLMELARQVVGDWPLLRQGPYARHLYLVE